jgi:hypothetical protein
VRNGSTLLGTLTARRGLIGQGGYVTGGEVAGDGTIVARTDTFNGWLLKAGETEFVPLVRPGDNISASDIYYDPAGQGLGTYDWGRVGTYDVAICYGNSSYIWLHSMFNLYKTTDGGTTLTKVTAFPQITDSNMNPNDQAGTGRTRGRYIAVDPANGAHCLVCTPSGVYRTTNGGTSWTLLTATLPAHGTNLRTQLAFDRSSSVVGSITQGVYAFVNDVGLYKSTDGGATWAAVGGSGAPTTCAHMRVHPTTGHIYTAGTASAGTSGQLRRCDPAGPTWIAPSIVTSVKAIAINGANIYAQQTFGGLYVSNNYGIEGSWKLVPTSTGAFTKTSTATPWLSWTHLEIANGDLTYDTTNSRLVLFEGMGIWASDNPPTTTTTTSIAWYNIGTGVDGIVAMGAQFDPEGNLHIGAQDKAEFSFSKTSLNSRTMATRHGLAPVSLRYAQCAPDYAIDDHTFLAVATGSGANSGGYSTDSGVTWQQFAADSGFIYGNIAVSNKLNMVWVPGNNAGVPKYTTDGGATWTSSTGFPVGYQNWINVYTQSRKMIVADKNNAGHFYLYAHGVGGSGQVSTAVGFWKSTDSGASWTRVFALPVSHATNYGIDFYFGKLKQVREVPGHFFWTGGGNGTGLYKNTNYCAGTTRAGDWPKVGPMTEVFAYGFGKAKYGASYPTILAVGWGVDPADSVNKYGFWLSYDGGTTWTYWVQFLRNKHDLVLDIAGDPSKYGRWAIAYAGSGFDLIDYSYTMRLS